MERPRPSSSAAPSIWYAAVAAPQRKSAGKPAGSGVRGRVTDLSSVPGVGALPTACRSEDRRSTPFRARYSVGCRGHVVLQQLVAEEGRGVVAAQVQVPQVGEVVAEAVTDL